jgi:hypothetical protein
MAMKFGMFIYLKQIYKLFCYLFEMIRLAVSKTYRIYLLVDSKYYVACRIRSAVSAKRYSCHSLGRREDKLLQTR